MARFPIARLFLAVAMAGPLGAAATPPSAPVVTSPAPLPAADGRVRVFLGGSIEMGRTGDWQAEVAQALAGEPVLLLNPRRADWNQAWKPQADEPEFRRQVEWELAALEQADIVLMYFAPGTQSPITLLEFGLYARSGKLRVAAPEGFWRKGNLDITGDRYGVPRHESLPALVEAVRREVRERTAR